MNKGVLWHCNEGNGYREEGIGYRKQGQLLIGARMNWVEM